MRPDAVTLTMRQLDRLKILQALADGHLKTGIAAVRLGVSLRQALRLLRRYQAQGAAGLQNRHQGQPGNNQLPPGLESRVRGLIRDSYADFGPTLAAEKLRERHGIDLATETVRRIMIDAGFWVPRKLRPPKVHQPRNRRACLGELVQIDGSDHAWFEDRAPACTLLVYVDDATGRLISLAARISPFSPIHSAIAGTTSTRVGTPVTIVATAVASTTAAPMNTPAAPFASNTKPPAAAPVAIASCTAATIRPPALSASSGTVRVTHVDHATGTPPNAMPHSAISTASMTGARPSATSAMPSTTINAGIAISIGRSRCSSTRPASDVPTKLAMP